MNTKNGVAEGGRGAKGDGGGGGQSWAKGDGGAEGRMGDGGEGFHLDGALAVGGHDDVAVLLPADGRHELVHFLLLPMV